MKEPVYYGSFPLENFYLPITRLILKSIYIFINNSMALLIIPLTKEAKSKIGIKMGKVT